MHNKVYNPLRKSCLRETLYINKISIPTQKSLQIFSRNGIIHRNVVGNLTHQETEWKI